MDVIAGSGGGESYVTNVKDFGAVGDGEADDTDALQAALSSLTNGGELYFPAGTYQISDTLEVLANTTVTMSSAVIVNQTTANKCIFRATEQPAIHLNINGGLLVGEGTWSAEWTGNSGHDDVAIQFINCNNSIITKPRIRNCGW